MNEEFTKACQQFDVAFEYFIDYLNSREVTVATEIKIGNLDLRIRRKQRNWTFEYLPNGEKEWVEVENMPRKIKISILKYASSIVQSLNNQVKNDLEEMKEAVIQFNEIKSRL